MPLVNIEGKNVFFPDTMSMEEIESAIKASRKQMKVEPETSKEVSSEPQATQPADPRFGEIRKPTFFERIKSGVQSPDESVFQRDLPMKGMTKEETGKTALIVASLLAGGAASSLPTKLTRVGADITIGATTGAGVAKLEDKDVVKGAKVGAVLGGVTSIASEAISGVLTMAPKLGLSKRGKQLASHVEKSEDASKVIQATKETADEVIEGLREGLQTFRKEAGKKFEKGLKKATVKEGSGFIFPDKNTTLIASDDMFNLLKKARQAEGISFEGLSGKQTENLMRKMINQQEVMSAEELSIMNRVLNRAIQSAETQTLKSGLNKVRQEIVKQSKQLTKANKQFAKEVGQVKELDKLTKGKKSEEAIVETLADAVTAKKGANKSLLDELEALDKKLNTNFKDQVLGTALKREFENVSGGLSLGDYFALFKGGPAGAALVGARQASKQPAVKKALLSGQPQEILRRTGQTLAPSLTLGLPNETNR